MLSTLVEMEGIETLSFVVDDSPGSGKYLQQRVSSLSSEQPISAGWPLSMTSVLRTKKLL